MLCPIQDHRRSTIFVVGMFQFLERATFGCAFGRKVRNESFATSCQAALHGCLPADPPRFFGALVAEALA